MQLINQSGIREKGRGACVNLPLEMRQMREEVYLQTTAVNGKQIFQ